MSPFLALALLLAPNGAAAGDRAAAPELPRYAIKVAKAVTASADDRVFDNAVILVSNGKIEKVGRAVDVPIPAGYEVVDAGTKWAVPGFVDCHDHIGGGLQDLNDGVFLTNPGLRSLDTITPEVAVPTQIVPGTCGFA